MSKENVEIVRQFFGALSAEFQDETSRGAMQRLAHKDVVYVEDPKWPGSSTYRGHEAVGECWAKYGEVMGRAAAATVAYCRDAGEQVVAIVRVSGHARASGIPFDHTWGYVCRTNGDRLSYFRAYFDPDEALEAAGLAE